VVEAATGASQWAPQDWSGGASPTICREINGVLFALKALRANGAKRVAERKSLKCMAEGLLTVADLATRWNCTRDYVYRRLNPSHRQFIPHKRLPSGDVRFDLQELAGYLIEIG